VHDQYTATGPIAAARAEPVQPLEARQVADIQVSLGQTLEKRGDYEQAEAAYREAVKQAPTRGDAWARLAVLDDRQGKFAESAECYRKAMELQGASASLCNNQGYSLYLQRRWAEAERSLRQALALDPANKRAHNNLGLLLAHAGQDPEGLSEFRQAGCTEAEAHANVALARAMEGDRDGALAHYERAAAIDPNSVSARRGLKQMRELVARAAPAEAGPRASACPVRSEEKHEGPTTDPTVVARTP
jgi:Tfp pilus assembly protein PilF